MRPLRYSINVSLDGCCDHRAFGGGEALHRHAADNLARADALLFGRTTFEMMRDAFARGPGDAPSSDPFERAIDAAPKHVVSRTLEDVGWNAELVQGDLGEAVAALKQTPGRGLLLGGVALPLALAELGLVDEYELVVHPIVVGHGPTLFAGLGRPLDLQLVEEVDLDEGVVARRYAPRTPSGRTAVAEPR